MSLSRREREGGGGVILTETGLYVAWENEIGARRARHPLEAFSARVTVGARHTCPGGRCQGGMPLPKDRCPLHMWRAPPEDRWSPMSRTGGPPRIPLPTGLAGPPRPEAPSLRAARGSRRRRWRHG